MRASGARQADRRSLPIWNFFLAFSENLRQVGDCRCIGMHDDVTIRSRTGDGAKGQCTVVPSGRIDVQCQAEMLYRNLCYLPC